MKVDQGVARAMNRRAILNLLRSSGPTSRADLAVRIGLSPATVTFVVADLIEEGLLVEGEPSPGAAGRRPIPVEINYDGMLAVGLKVMMGSMECVLTNLATVPLLTETVSLTDQLPETVAEAAARAVTSLVSKVNRPDAKVVGVGLAIPGVFENGTCIRSARFHWDNVPIAKMLAERINVPVWVEDDTNAFALAQQLFRLGRHHKTMGALAIGAGISCAVVVNGALHHGAHGAAGKLGHSTFDPHGPLCECGRRGCLQAMFSEPEIVRRWQETGAGSGQSRSDMVAAAEAGDANAINILAEAGRAIGGMLAVFCNVVDPEVIVVGGEAVAFGEWLFGPMRQALEAGAVWTAPPITPDWADNSWAQGAAALATQQVFDFQALEGTVV